MRTFGEQWVGGGLFFPLVGPALDLVLADLDHDGQNEIVCTKPSGIYAYQRTSAGTPLVWADYSAYESIDLTRVDHGGWEFVCWLCTRSGRGAPVAFGPDPERPRCTDVVS